MTGEIDVLCIGFGALGVIYSYLLESSGKCRVTAIGRSSYEAINRHGVRIDSSKFGDIKAWKPHRLVKDPKDATDRKYSFILCTFKCLPDIHPTSAALAPFMDRTSPPTIILIQNGIGIEQPVAEAFPRAHVISCVAWIGANFLMREGLDGVVVPTVEHGSLERLVVGLYEGEGGSQHWHHDENAPLITNSFIEGLMDDNGAPLGGKLREARCETGRREVARLAEMLNDGGGNAEIVDDVQPARWAKNMWNAGWSCVCTMSRSTLSACVAPEILAYTLPVVRRTMLEVLYVARAMNYGEKALPAQSVDDAIRVTLKNYQVRKPHVTTAMPGLSKSDAGEGGVPPDALDSPFDDEDDELTKEARLTVGFKPSMLLDIENSRPIELEPIIGAVLDRARAKALETPRLDVMYATLKIAQEAAARRYAASLSSPAHELHLHEWSMRKPSVSGAGSAPSRDAWMKEVRRRVILEQQASRDVAAAGGGGLQLPARLGAKSGKVTGRPLAVVDRV